MAGSFHDQVLGRLADTLNNSQGSSDQRLYAALRLLAKYRSQLIANTLRKLGGTAVRGGPFKGMEFAGQVSEGCYVPKLLGCYEQELHPVLARLPDMEFDQILNIGCAEGYYAVGLALLLSRATVIARDTDQRGREACQELAWQNGVAGRLKVGGEFRHADFAMAEGRTTLVVCDIEGGEDALLDPAKAPALAGCHILVELHEVLDPALPDRVLGRFADSHRIERIGHGDRDTSAYPELQQFEHLDQLLAVWEWRAGPTPWAYLTPKLG